MHVTNAHLQRKNNRNKHYITITLKPMYC